MKAQLKNPLQWPVGYKRITRHKRALFRNKTVHSMRVEIVKQINLLNNAKDVYITCEIPLRNDGEIYQAFVNKQPDDRGVAVYFTLNGEQVCLAADQYNRIEDNLCAVAKTIEALRAIDRYGVSDFLKHAFTGFVALPEKGEGKHWSLVLGIPESSTLEEIKTAYRKLSMTAHPDKGGELWRWHEINKAYEEAIK